MCLHVVGISYIKWGQVLKYYNYPAKRDSVWLHPSKDPPLAEKVIMQDLTPKLLKYFLTIEDNPVVKRHIQIKLDRLLLTAYELEQNYPNPFNPVTTISFQLPKASNVTLVIYNIQGQEVARLVDGYVGAGYHSVNWDASNAASGIYIYRLQSRLSGFSDTKRMLYIK